MIPSTAQWVCRVQSRKEMECQLSSVLESSRMTKLSAPGAEESGKGGGK